MTTFTLQHGDARACLREQPALSVQTVVTSPPYWGLRDYGAEGQIGLEATPDDFVASLVEVFREVWRVLKDDGTLWLNLGDTYARQAGGDGHEVDRGLVRTGRTGHADILFKKGSNRPPEGVKPKDLLGIPWRVAFALQADGWYLRSDIIWHKPNPMPESVTDRPTKAHEYLFLLTKNAKYYYDAAAIAEPICEYQADRIRRESARGMNGLHHDKDRDSRRDGGVASSQHGARAHLLDGRNKRSVWTIPTQAFQTRTSRRFLKRWSSRASWRGAVPAIWCSTHLPGLGRRAWWPSAWSASFSASN